jgi:serine/threonine protein kinase
VETPGAETDPNQGQVVADRYLLLSLCGKGGMGSVWRAQDLREARECAVKILHRTAPERVPHLAERFLREAKVATAIDSPNAVRVLDYGVDGGLPFIVMELLEGETLAATLRRSGRITAVETFAIVDQVAKALARAHEIGVVHRDLKPANIFLSRASDGGITAKVLDFGIAKIVDDETISRDLTETGAVLGTPHYMSPEQIDGARYVDRRADLWSLAVIAFECITGRRPFQGDGLRALFLAICVHERPLASALCSVPSGFDAWFAKCTNTDPAKRHRSAMELAEELGRVCHGTITETEQGATRVGGGATQDGTESGDSLSGSVAVPRFASERGRWLAAHSDSKQRAKGTLDSSTRRSRWPSFRVLAISVVLLASGAWLSVGGTASKPPARTSESFAPLPSGVEQAPAPLASVSVPVIESRRGTSAPHSSAFDPKAERQKPRMARAVGFRHGAVPKPTPLEAHDAGSVTSAQATQLAVPVHSPETVPAEQAIPSAKPELWNFSEMLKDRK